MTLVYESAADKSANIVSRVAVFVPAPETVLMAIVMTRDNVRVFWTGEYNMYEKRAGDEQ
jgi:hypothetical protein